ncbi:MAG: DNA pilot protein [Microvirus sp.]|nr:MAG: DNA pilot protein [Microvirus sp.]
MGLLSSLGDALGSAGGLVSDVFNYWSGQNEQGKAQNFNANQARAQMDFQERMSNTQYQRATKDMAAAGLNPMLAYTQGGAGNLSGSAASISATANQSAAASAQAGLTRAQTQLASAQAANVEADTENKVASNPDRNPSRDVSASQVSLNRKTIDRISEEIPKLIAETANVYQSMDTSHAQEKLNDAVRRKVFAETANLSLTAKQIEQITKKTTAETALLMYSQNKAKNLSQAETTWWKEFVAPYIDDVRKLIPLTNQ